MSARVGFQPLRLRADELRAIVAKLDEDDAGDNERVEVWRRRRGRGVRAKFRYANETHEARS